MIIVSNTSLIINLAAIKQLELLQVAKQREYLVAVKPLLQDLMVVAGFWIDRELYARVLESAGEL